jgi:hypothetical protein
MTAIVSVYTPEGFVIGADGRLLNPEGTIESDDTQKIFECSAVNVVAAGAWSGCTRFGDSASQFDLKTRTREIAESISIEEFETLFDYAIAIAFDIEKRFLRWLRESSGSIDPKITELARMLLVGYVDGSPQSAEIHLSARQGVWQAPGLCSPTDSLSSDLNSFSGKQAIVASMRSTGEISPCMRLTDGERQIRAYIERCAGLSDEAGNSIGGHIHIAAVTPDGVRWLIPPRSYPGLLRSG